MQGGARYSYFQKQTANSYLETSYVFLHSFSSCLYNRCCVRKRHSCFLYNQRASWVTYQYAKKFPHLSHYIVFVFPGLFFLKMDAILHVSNLHAQRPLFWLFKGNWSDLRRIVAIALVIVGLFFTIISIWACVYSE